MKLFIGSPFSNFTVNFVLFQTFAREDHLANMLTHPTALRTMSAHLFSTFLEVFPLGHLTQSCGRVHLVRWDKISMDVLAEATAHHKWLLSFHLLK